MPPRSQVSLLKRASYLADSSFICPSCSHARSPRIRTGATKFYNPPTTTFRHAATSTTPPAAALRSSIVNATNNVPERYRDLYEALDEVKHSAAQHVNLSRLQLALRGLESETPVIRVAGRLPGQELSRSGRITDFLIVNSEICSAWLGRYRDGS